MKMEAALIYIVNFVQHVRGGLHKELLQLVFFTIILMSFETKQILVFSISFMTLKVCLIDQGMHIELNEVY